MTVGGTNGTARAIVAENLGKRYYLGQSASLKQSLAHLTRQELPARQEIDALQDLSFSIDQGECFGVVGKNGSGKSTLFQLISSITLPSTGKLSVRGRVLPLLSVGHGFHPELTGLENIGLFGTILGLERRDIASRTGDILAFTALEAHADTPVKRYSDGMQARLSVGLAMLFPADIYLLDEVLAVVDDEFRKQCVNELDRLAEENRTVIYVSHDLEQVRRISSRVMWIDGGHLRALGPPDEVIDEYLLREGSE